MGRLIHLTGKGTRFVKRNDKMKENYLYFSEGGGANATTEAGCFSCARLRGVYPDGTGAGANTTIAFDGTTNAGDSGEYVTITHTNNRAGTGHDVRKIAEAVAKACNASPHNDGPIVMIDLDQTPNEFYDELIYLRSDSSLALAITLDS